MNTQNPDNKNLLVSVASIVTLGVIGAIAYNYLNPKFNVKINDEKKEVSTPITTPTVTSINNTENDKIESMDQDSKSQNDTSSQYKNGTYYKTGKYTSPAGPEDIEVSVTLENGNIKEATVTSKATVAASIRFQGQFVSGYKEYVVGKNIDEVKLDVVAGSSLTPKGFNDALEQIKQEAKM